LKKRVKPTQQLIALAYYFNIPQEKVEKYYIATYARNALKWTMPVRTAGDANHVIRAAYKRLIGPIKNQPTKETNRKIRKLNKFKERFLERKAFYDSDEWRSLRYKAFKEYGRKCFVCGATPESGAQLHVDHVKPRSKFPELELVLGNLQILCKDCNLGKSNTDSIDWKKADNGCGVGADSETPLSQTEEKSGSLQA